MVTRISAPSATATEGAASPLRKARAQAPAVARRAAQALPPAARKAAGVVQKNVRRAATGMLGLSGERMSKVDTAWLRMDSASNLMMINGVWTLSPGIGWEALCERVQQRLLQYPRFRQRVVEDAAGATWVEDRQFDIAAHVLREKLTAPKGEKSMQRALQDRVGELAMQPLDPRRPLWQMHLIEDFVGDDGQPGSALIVRIHHCIADGIALISVTMSIVDGGAEPPKRTRKEREQAATAEDWIAETLIKPFTGMTVKALDLAGDGAAKSLQMLGDPEKTMHSGLSGTMDMARVAYQLVSDAAALALMPDDSPTRLKGQPGSAKRVAWCPPIPLEEVKAIGKALNCSINDVLLSCVAGAIGGYLRSEGDDPTGHEIRAMIPVNLRPMEDAWKLGNRFGLVPLVLPIGMANPVERVYEVRRRMNALKGSTQPILAFAMLAVAGLMIKPAQDALLNLFGRKTTAVMTNVPGPKEQLTLCGARVTQCMFWVPQSGDIGLGVSILSYGGGVQFGVITDTALCPEPQRIIDAFAPEFAQLSLLTLMLPWGE
ncbi:diacylglycerol O-acyltransferase [Acidovorax sp. Leaf76]|uniref:wax ester/triacylglycerol synthase family O-acyltransferase n=1 Tax=unclassified Acidovorax TaxID=2684926 RepID=UPI0006F20355|nr:MULTISPECIES: wax ester/triacylglycerol synthase family O-acyltransferase [unclassified Acidovorax]KQO26236.1 diacylglycerol O-acyltransferase [Acidovorax sp. Leaf76]KQO35834.1 diacylglycerol O-acyltransferase [Acidovorax sp. Leaf84]KQS38255.1 diacylglycerol O-acyltransferase [Acidovorax sp. Leaf191]